MQLETANQMTLQQLFDYAVERLVQQGEPCRDDHGRCVYGNSRNQHCGIGWMLDDTNPDLMHFGGAVGQLAESYPNHVPVAIMNNLDVAALFQLLHDRKDSPTWLHNTWLDLKHNGIDVSGPHWKRWIEL